MRVVQVLGGAEDGGLEKHTIELSRSLQAKDIDVTVIAHEKFKNDFKDVKFIALDLTKSRNNPIILYRLYKILKTQNYDIIHTQANKATDMVVKLKPFLKSKIVSTLHNYKKNTKSFDKTDLVITVSSKIGEVLITKKKTTIYNGIKASKVDSIDLHEKYNIPKDKFIICSVGRFVKVKKFNNLLKSIKDLDIYLVIIGDGYEKENLLNLSKELSIENKITFTGMLDSDSLLKVVKSSKLFVMTSDREGFPYTFVESMFCKTPFLSTPVSDIETFITAKYIVPFNDVRALSEKIGYIKDNYETVVDDFQKVFDKSENEFSIEHMVNRTIEMYKMVLNEI